MWQVARVCDAAVQCWWEDSHPGWMIFTLGNQHFETLDQIIQVRGRRLAGFQAGIRVPCTLAPASQPT